MNVDTIDFTSRNFYESTRFKFFASLMMFSSSLMCLGMTSAYGGSSEYYFITAVDMDDDLNSTLSGTYGFGTFTFSVGFVLFAAAGVYYNPHFYGTHNEKSTLSDPIQIDGESGVSSSFKGETYTKAE